MKVYLRVDATKNNKFPLYVKDSRKLTTYEALMSEGEKTQAILTQEVKDYRIFKSKKDAYSYIRHHKIKGMSPVKIK